ncbi:hypothetical protein ES705_48089 [subsurface metagenome]
MELKKAKAIADELVELLRLACERLVVAGSIRRRKPDVGDIELLCIPKFVEGVDQLDQKLKWLIGTHVLEYRPNKKGSIVYGPKNKLLRHADSDIGVDIFSTDEECWWVALVVRTGPKESNIAIATTAQKRGWRLRAYGAGFDTPEGLIRCKSERDVFELVGLPYKEPRERR